MARRRYTPKLKPQVLLEVLAGDRTPGQINQDVRSAPELGGAVEAAFRRAGARDLRRADDGQRMRASHPGSGTDCFTGFAVGERANSELALKAWAAAERNPDALCVDRPPAWGAGVWLWCALQRSKDNPEMESSFDRFQGGESISDLRR